MKQVLGAGALGRPSGIQWRGRWAGGSGWGIHVNPWLIHVSVWQKPLQYCKVISLQLIKVNGKHFFLTWKGKGIRVANTILKNNTMGGISRLDVLDHYITTVSNILWCCWRDID